MAKMFTMQAERVAYYEAAGWKAYYDHKWFKMLWLLIRLCQEQFHIPFPMSLVAAYYTTRASLAWVPIEHDEQKVLKYLEKFYGVGHRYSGLDYDVKKVANLELKYYEVHRRLSGTLEKEELLQTFIELHCALFGLTPDQVRESAEWRLLATDTVDLITSRTSTNIEQDWRKLEGYLQKAYGSISEQLVH